jgi:ferredoxin
MVYGREMEQPDGVSESLLVRAHPGLCEAWGQCHRWAPEVYPLDDEGYLDIHVLEVPPEHAVRAWMAAKACPVGVITVVDKVVRAPLVGSDRGAGPASGG